MSSSTAWLELLVACARRPCRADEQDVGQARRVGRHPGAARSGRPCARWARRPELDHGGRRWMRPGRHPIIAAGHGVDRDSGGAGEAVSGNGGVAVEEAGGAAVGDAVGVVVGEAGGSDGGRSQGRRV
jgi:hypothetical protein